MKKAKSNLEKFDSVQLKKVLDALIRLRKDKELNKDEILNLEAYLAYHWKMEVM